MSEHDFISQLGINIYFAGAGYLVAVFVAVRQIVRARRVHYVGRISDEVYRARLVGAAASIIILPLLVVIGHWLDFWAGIILTFLWLGIAIWADEIEKPS